MYIFHIFNDPNEKPKSKSSKQLEKELKKKNERI